MKHVKIVYKVERLKNTDATLITPSLPFWKRACVAALMGLMRYLIWDYRRLDRLKVCNLKRRSAVTDLLADLTHYEDAPKTDRQRADDAIDEIEILAHCTGDPNTCSVAFCGWPCCKEK